MKTNILLTGILLLITSSVYSQVSTTGLVAFYPFNGNANDSTGNDHNGVVLGATLTTDRFGKTNNAYSFNGSSDYIEITSANTLRLPEYTYEAWIYPTANPIGGIIANGGATILDIGGEIGDQVLNIGNFLGAYIGIGGFGYYLGGGTYNTQTGVLPALNHWYHVVGTRSSTHYKLFINGVLIQSVPLLPIAPEYDVSTIGFIGKRIGDIQYFNGKIDDVRIYNSAMTEVQVKELYINESLVAWYPFNGNAIDESGNGHDGTINGNTTLTSDRFNGVNKAFTFPDQSSSISLTNSTALNLESGFTINAWIKYKNNNTTTVIVCKHVCGYVNGFFFGIDTDGQIQLWLGNSVWSTVRTNRTYIENQWYMVSATFDANTGIAKVFVNGELSGSGSVTYNNFSSNPISIGETYQNNCGPGYMSGAVDEVKIYNLPLSEAEIKQEYNSSRNSLIAYYPFNGNANDESGNGNHGTITGALITPAADRYGEEGKAYKFWFPDYISVPTNSSFFSDEFTVSYWYKVEAYWGDRGVLSCVGNKGGYQQVFSAGTTFTYLLGYNFPTGSWFWTNYTVSNTPNTWQHITTTYKKTGDNSSISKLYINGEMKSSEVYANSIAYPGSEIFYIGRNHSDLGLNGELDDVRFYNRVLTDAEVLALHATELPNAVNSQFISNIIISPNPTDGHFVIDLGSNYQNIKINISDITGRTIKEAEYSNVQKLNHKIEAPSGIYFINIITENERATCKLIKN